MSLFNRLKLKILLKYLTRKVKKMSLPSHYPTVLPIDYSMELLAEIRGGRNKAIMTHHGWYVGGFFVRQSVGDLPGPLSAEGDAMTEADVPHLEELYAACCELELEPKAFGADDAADKAFAIPFWLPLLLQYLPLILELLKKK